MNDGYKEELNDNDHTEYTIGIQKKTRIKSNSDTVLTRDDLYYPNY